MLFNPNWAEPKVDAIGARLLDAAAYLKTHHWCTNERFAADGRVCIEGAIIATGDRPIDSQPAIWRVEAYLGTTLATWNDRDCRSEQEAWECLISAAYYSDSLG